MKKQFTASEFIEIEQLTEKLCSAAYLFCDRHSTEYKAAQKLSYIVAVLRFSAMLVEDNEPEPMERVLELFAQLNQGVKQ